MDGSSMAAFSGRTSCEARLGGVAQRFPTGDLFLDGTRPAFTFPDTTGSEGVSPSISSLGLSTYLRGGLIARWQRAATTAKSLKKVVRRAPMTIILPVFLCLVLCAAGELALWGVWKSFASDRSMLTANTATTAVQQIELLLQSWIAPVVALASVIKRTPDVPDLVQNLPDVLGPILDKMDSANATVRLSIYPWLINQGALPLTNTSLGWINTNLLNSSAYKNSFKQFAGTPADYSDVWGPVLLMDLTMGFVMRFNIWLPSPSHNDTWGMDTTFNASWAPGRTMGNYSWKEQKAKCGAGCNERTLPDGTPLVYWGMASNIISDWPLTDLLNTLSDPGHQNVPFKYVLMRKVDPNLNDPASLLDENTMAAGQLVIYKSPGDTPLNPKARTSRCRDLGSTLTINMTWTLCVAPVDDCRPVWLVPLAVLVPFVSLIIAALVFCLMASQEKHRLLVEAILPPKVIKQLSMGNVYMEDFKAVTALFSDIVSYTSIAAELTPTELVKMLDALYSAFDQLVDKHGLHKVETIGDAFFCVGGAPKPCKPQDAARRVALMALDMINFVEGFQCKHQIRIRIGLYTGDVTAAVMGSKVPHWALVGDTINVTARMESNSLPQCINIGPTTAALLAPCPDFELEARGVIDIKGKGAMRCYWLRAAAPKPETMTSPASTLIQSGSQVTLLPRQLRSGEGFVQPPPTQMDQQRPTVQMDQQSLQQPAVQMDQQSLQRPPAQMDQQSSQQPAVQMDQQSSQQPAVQMDQQSSQRSPAQMDQQPLQQQPVQVDQQSSQRLSLQLLPTGAGDHAGVSAPISVRMPGPNPCHEREQELGNIRIQIGSLDSAKGAFGHAHMRRR